MAEISCSNLLESVDIICITVPSLPNKEYRVWQKNVDSAEHVFWAPVFITSQYHHHGIAGFAVTGFIDRDNAVFEFLAAGLLNQRGFRDNGGGSLFPESCRKGQRRAFLSTGPTDKF